MIMFWKHLLLEISFMQGTVMCVQYRFFIFGIDQAQIYGALWICMSYMDFYILQFKRVLGVFSTLYIVLVIANRMLPMGEKS